VSTTARPARWWEDEATAHRDGRQGRIVSPAGRSGAVMCPACGQEPVVYNGNYFCDGYPPIEGGPGTCDWALAHPSTSKRDRAFCDLVGLDYH
jgi:hypothetical protein